MTDTVYVSRIGRWMRERGIRRQELRRRLAARGVKISRGTLDRLVSERPIDDVRLGAVIPILEEVELDFRDAFEAVSRQEVEERARAEREAELAATRLYRAGASHPPEAEASDADAELAEALARSRGLLRARLPEVFDRRGRLRRRRLEEAIAARLPGRSVLTRDEFQALTDELNKPSESSADAS